MGGGMDCLLSQTHSWLCQFWSTCWKRKKLSKLCAKFDWLLVWFLWTRLALWWVVFDPDNCDICGWVGIKTKTVRDKLINFKFLLSICRWYPLIPVKHYIQDFFFFLLTGRSWQEKMWLCWCLFVWRVASINSVSVFNPINRQILVKQKHLVIQIGALYRIQI